MTNSVNYFTDALSYLTDTHLYRTERNVLNNGSANKIRILAYYYYYF